MPAHILALDDALLVHVLSFADARDLKAMTVASRLVALHLLPHYPTIWRVLFVRRWEKLNFALHVDATAKNVLVDKRLRAFFAIECTESQIFQMLTSAIVQLPSGMDIQKTQEAWGYSKKYHGIVSLDEEMTEDQASDGVMTSFAFNGKHYGNDRSVRANVSFPTSLHIVVFKRRRQNPASNKESFAYHISATASNYFEISIGDPDSRQSSYPLDNERMEMTAIGLVPSTFPLVGKQPGWTMPSFGYHGDNGKFYSALPVSVFGPRFGLNDTVGCGIRRSSEGKDPHVFFTHNGCLVASPNLSKYLPCNNEHDWFPAVGLDSPNTIRVNFGQQPFKYDYAIDEVYSECLKHNALMARQMLQDTKKARFRTMRRNCIGAFVANVLERRRMTYLNI